MRRRNDLFPISCYRDLEKYHEQEVGHIYYREMHEKILDFLKDLVEEKGRELKVLEVGAGTGILTRQLTTIDGVQLTCLEPDSRSRELLARTTKGEINIILQGAEECDTEEGFDVIVSSFSHDHVRDGYKLAQNIYRMLKLDGIYIAGIEMLRPYDTEEERVEALQVWHGLVIDDARQKGLEELAKLEEEAMISGIRRVADFKKDEKRLEDELTNAGLQLIEKRKVGPEIEDVGGVLVYVYIK